MNADNSVPEIILYGAGGHAVSVIDALLASGLRPSFIVDDNPCLQGRPLMGFPVFGRAPQLARVQSRGGSVVVAVARNDVRRRLVGDMASLGLTAKGVRHPAAVISASARVHETAQIMAGVIVNAGAVVGAHAVLNTGCVIEHNAVIGPYVHIAGGAVLAGAVIVEEGALVAIGAKVCPFVRIGAWSTLGAGAVALRDVPPQSLAVGVPARAVVKEQPA